MSDDGTNVNFDFSPTDFIVGLASIYVLFNYGAFLAWAAGLGAPFAGLATIIVYLLIIVDVIETIALAIIGIIAVLFIVVALFKILQWIVNR
ncbi:hypothetical protein M199_gp175 [Halogranum tailed virus 1]|uniref:Uncharacterized protein n=1 Tax=Halogranum tailed virus 1 TaxID=1273749 RepID=R4TGU6_9CAUD|nr:hypothetical protein M199_gp175 [Halogranum tailed virus 1]AGM11491.1 hypothetical protein HGTV1_194 [Halogranum tailed virus 1]